MDTKQREGLILMYQDSYMDGLRSAFDAGSAAWDFAPRLESPAQASGYTGVEIRLDGFNRGYWDTCAWLAARDSASLAAAGDCSGVKNVHEV